VKAVFIVVPQLVLAQISFIVPRYPISPRINRDRIEEGFVLQPPKTIQVHNPFAVVNLLHPVDESDK
jgi:hypothetical protein